MYGFNKDGERKGGGCKVLPSHPAFDCLHKNHPKRKKEKKMESSENVIFLLPTYILQETE